MDWTPQNLAGIAVLGSLVVSFLLWFARKQFVSWSKDNITIESSEATASMMANFKSEIQRLSENNRELTDENRQLQKQINRLEAILQKIAVKFDIELSEYSDAGLH